MHVMHVTAAICLRPSRSGAALLVKHTGERWEINYRHNKCGGSSARSACLCRSPSPAGSRALPLSFAPTATECQELSSRRHGPAISFASLVTAACSMDRGTTPGRLWRMAVRALFVFQRKARDCKSLAFFVDVICFAKLGTLRFCDGSVYAGAFVGRHPHGVGSLSMANGRA